MAQDISEKIRAAAVAKGIDPDLAVRIAKAESSLRPEVGAKTSSAKGLFGIIDSTWNMFGGAPGQQTNTDENIRVGMDIIASNTGYLKKKLGRDPQPSEVYAAHFFGPTGAMKFLSTGPDTPMESVFSKKVMDANPHLQGKTAQQIRGMLAKKVGEDSTAVASSSTSAPAIPQAQPKSGIQRAVYKAAPLTHPMLSQLGPNYQAALAVSMLADQGEKEGKSEDDESESEKMMKEYMETPARPVALASADLGYQTPFPAVVSSAPAKEQLQSFKHGGAVHRAGGSPETGEYFQDPMGVIDTGPVTADTFVKGKDFKAADALQAAKEVGKGMVRSGKAIAQGVSETPYNVVGAPVDIATMVMRPFGYNVQEPTGGSEHLKRLALEAGIRQAPPTDPRDLGYYTIGELGSSIVNPGPIAAKVGQATEKAVTTGSKAVAREMLRGMEGQGVLAPVSPQGSIMYAVKPKGGAFTGTREYEYTPSGGEGRETFEDDVTRFIKAGEFMPEEVRPELKIPVQSRNALTGWIEDKIGNYIRRDMATTNDPFVKAMDEGKKLHLLEGLGDIKPMSGLARRRHREGFPAWGSAKTPLGRKLEKQIDSSMWSEDIGDVDTYNMHPSMESFKDTNPNMQIYTPGSQIANRMQFPKMIEGMEDMLSTDKNYKAYGEFSTPIPEEYHLTPEKLQGLSAVQASEKVGLFNQWRDKERQVQAAKYLDKYGNTYKKYDNGRKWIAMDDLAEEPRQAELVQQAGCLGGWCTKNESFAMENGSGENRLHLLFDEKAVPRVQLTVTKKEASADDFITQLEYDDFNSFNQQYGDINRMPSSFIEGTPEFQTWERMQGNPERITEIKGQFNTSELAKNPSLSKYLKEVQDFVKSKDWGTVANLDGINMIDLDDYVPTLSRGLNPEQRNQLSDFMKNLNGGSRYADKNESENILTQAALRVFQPFTPPGRATGGMVERQANTARYI
jgi:hypothetical protein